MANFIRRILPEAMSFIIPQKMVRSISSSHKLDLDVIRNELRKFEGGAVDLEMDDQTGIAVLTLNNPLKLNCLTGYMLVEMADRITQLENWTDGKGLILKGVGGNFCSGGDVTIAHKARHYGAETSALLQDTMTRLFNLPLISAALLQGYTLGVGVEISTACDFRIMSHLAKVGFVQIKMGLTTGGGATTRLVHMLGRQKTISLLSSAKVMTAEEAHSEGLVNYVLSSSLTSAEEFGECRKWLISNYCKHDADLIQATKKLIVFSDQNRDVTTSLNNERDVFAKYWGGPVHAAIVTAVNAKK